MVPGEIRAPCGAFGVPIGQAVGDPIAAVACVLVSTVPAVQRVLKTVPVPTADWAWIIGLALLGALSFSLLGGLIPSRAPQATLKKATL